MVATFFVADFLALFRAGRADFFLLATLAPSTLEVSSNFSCRKPTRDLPDGLAFSEIHLMFASAMHSKKGHLRRNLGQGSGAMAYRILLFRLVLPKVLELPAGLKIGS